VIKADNMTIFPSLFSSQVLKPGTVETVYHLNLIDAWQISGISVPTYLNVFMEKIVSFYMEWPKFQQIGLKIRNAIFTLFHSRSTMKPGKSYGYCGVLYQVEDHRLKISVNGQSLQHHDELILLNEVPGIGFSRMKSGQNTRDGANFLPWQPCTIDTAIENPALHIGFHLSFPDAHSPQCAQIAAGKEVGLDLNWAGLSITTELVDLTYHVNFYSKKNGAIQF
ncbi:MAG: hypothetical protein HQK62_15405, partial [Desulfamplus sp.]|nr:hypothetical protein [Desulfamplus sp.]